VKIIQVHSFEESLDYLRVGIKYLLFEIEATQRENEVLKKENAELEKLLEDKWEEG